MPTRVSVYNWQRNQLINEPAGSASDRKVRHLRIVLCKRIVLCTSKETASGR